MKKISYVLSLTLIISGILLGFYFRGNIVKSPVTAASVTQNASFNMQKPTVETNDSTPTVEASATIETSSTVEATQVVNFLAVGDIMCHSQQFKAVASSGYDFRNNFTPVKSIISGADLALGNLETTLRKSGPYSGYPAFHSPKRLADSLKSSGFDILTTANNHSLDGGKTGVVYTATYLKKLGIAATGTNNNPPIIKEVNGIKIGIISYTYGTNGIHSPFKGAVNRMKESTILSAIKSLKPKVDCVIVMLHWGNEYRVAPESVTVSLGHKLINGGADMIIGSHPHVARGIDKYKGKYIVYSMGNFISGQTQKYTDMGFMAAFTITKASGTVKIGNLKAIPVFRDHNSGAGTRSYRAVPLNYRDKWISRSDITRMNSYKKYSSKLFGSYYSPNFNW